MDAYEDFSEFGNAAENPALAAAAERLAAGTDAGPEPRPEDPSDGPVTLVAGFRRTTAGDGGVKFEEVKTAWVRELNGADEEKIARAKLKDDYSIFVAALLEAGVEKLGDLPPTRDDLDALVLGDRDYLLLEIARATYGDEIEYPEVTCPHCGKTVGVQLSISEDIPVKRLDSVDDQTFEVRLRKDRVAVVNLPTHGISSDLLKADTQAEANTVLIANCVDEIRSPGGQPPLRFEGDKEGARRLGLPDREKLIKEMSERMPGPQYNEVRFNHEPGCGEEIRLPISLADLFRGL